MKSKADSCDGKQQLTRQLANQILSREQRGRRSAYRCTFCGYWHLGSSIVPKIKRDDRAPRRSYPQDPLKAVNE